MGYHFLSSFPNVHEFVQGERSGKGLRESAKEKIRKERAIVERVVCDCLGSNMSANCREGTPPGKAQVGAWASLVDGVRELSYFQDS